MSTRRHFLLSLGAFTITGLIGCGDGKPRVTALHAVPLRADDECAVCGMNVLEFPGPKGQAWLEGADKPLNFCSTRDFFAYVLQPETGTLIRALFVHDMGATQWEKPADSAFVDAHTAWYVAGHRKPGAMGPTLAAFAERAAAEQFTVREGGRVLAFGDVNVKLLTELV